MTTTENRFPRRALGIATVHHLSSSDGDLAPADCGTNIHPGMNFTYDIAATDCPSCLAANGNPDTEDTGEPWQAANERPAHLPRNAAMRLNASADTSTIAAMISVAVYTKAQITTSEDGSSLLLDVVDHHGNPRMFTITVQES